MRVDGSYFLLCFIVAMEIVGLELHVTTFVALLMVMVLANVDDDDGDGGVAAQLQAAAGHTRAWSCAVAYSSPSSEPWVTT